MARTGAARILSAAFLLAAGSFEPAWQLGHSLLHLEAARHAHEESETGPHAPEPSWLSTLTDAAPDHRHLVIQPPARPGLDLLVAQSALPVAAPLLHPTDVTISRAGSFGAPARASPDLSANTRPRAPPSA